MMIRESKPHCKLPMHFGRQSIALISEHGDPAAELGRDAAGGQNVYVRQVGEALAKLGWQVDLFTRKTDPDQSTIVQHLPHCRTIRLSAGPETYIPRDQLFEHMPEFVESFTKFQAKDGGNYPLVHTNYWMSGWVGLQLKASHGIQVAHTYHSLGAVKYASMSERAAIARLRLDVERQILEQSDCVVATSPQEREQLRSFVSHKGKIEVIPCGTDTQNFRVLPKAQARAQLGLSESEKIVLYVGRFDPRKGIETLVRSFAKVAAAGEVTPLRLVVVGGSHSEQADSWEQGRIQQLVRESGIAAQTTFVGSVNHERLPLFYTAADVCVIPSHYEPFGLVAIEAMACGTPVIASDVGGLKFTVVPGETGLLVAPKDIDGFAIAMQQVLSREDWAAQAGTRAANWVQENFSWTGVAAHLSELYRWMLASSLVEPATTRTIEFASSLRLSA
jgi:D-inositol-3-phosphate glycosyltransferase